MPAFTKEYVRDFGNKFAPGQLSWLKKIARCLLIVLITTLTAGLAILFYSLVIAISNNIKISGSQTYFNPQITIGYLLVSYLSGYFYQLTRQQQSKLFFFSLIASFLIEFVPGTIFIVLLIPVLKKLKLIQQTPNNQS